MSYSLDPLLLIVSSQIRLILRSQSKLTWGAGGRGDDEYSVQERTNEFD